MVKAEKDVPSVTTTGSMEINGVGACNVTTVAASEPPSAGAASPPPPLLPPEQPTRSNIIISKDNNFFIKSSPYNIFYINPNENTLSTKM